MRGDYVSRCNALAYVWRARCVCELNVKIRIDARIQDDGVVKYCRVGEVAGKELRGFVTSCKLARRLLLRTFMA
jgi:hypothetical protein